MIKTLEKTYIEPKNVRIACGNSIYSRKDTIGYWLGYENEIETSEFRISKELYNELCKEAERNKAKYKGE